jgi:hypothetical protein
MPQKKQTNTAVPQNTFYKIFNFKTLDNDGTFTFLNIIDKPLYEFRYENGELHTFSVAQKGPPPAGTMNTAGNNIQRTESCTAWYWVTTNPDGSQNWEYLYTTCDGGGCDPYAIDCGGGGGGGSSEPESEGLRDVEWTVVSNPVNPNVGEIKSAERMRGRRVASQPQGGYFTGITHYWSFCNFCSSSEPYNVWWETSNSVSASAQSASSTVTGNLNYEGGSYPGLTNTKTWSFQQVFP